MQFQPNIDHPKEFQAAGGQMFWMWRQTPAGIRPFQLVALYPGTSGFTCSNGKCAGCRELYLGAQQNDVWTDRITSLLLVCEVHTLCGIFFTPLPSRRRGKGTVGGKRKWKAGEGGCRQGRRLCGARLPSLSDLFFCWETLKLPSQN